MSPFSAAATATKLAPTTNSTAPARLERVVEFESARWLPSLLSDLRSLETSGLNILGIGDLRVASSTADNVRRLLTLASAGPLPEPLPEPLLCPFSGGGVALSWNIGNRELTVTVYPQREDFVFAQTSEREDKNGIFALDQTAGVIAAFLTSPAQ